MFLCSLNHCVTSINIENLTMRRHKSPRNLTIFLTGFEQKNKNLRVWWKGKNLQQTFEDLSSRIPWCKFFKKSKILKLINDSSKKEKIWITCWNSILWTQKRVCHKIFCSSIFLNTNKMISFFTTACNSCSRTSNAVLNLDTQPNSQVIFSS